MTRALSIFLLVAAVAFAMGPFATPGFNGFEAGQFPVPQDDPPAQPAGYAFAIWGVIYVWLLIGAAFQLFARHDAPDWAPMRLPLVISLTVGAPWLAVAQISPVWATILIWIMWAGAALALVRAPRRDGWFGHGPLGLYAGWLTAAASVSLALMAAGYGLIAEVPAAILILVLALGLGGWLIRLRPDAPSFAVALVWALVGVTASNWPEGSLLIAVLAFFGAAGLAGLAYQLRRS